MTRGYRNCNPGNIRHSGTKWKGMRATQTDKSFVQFSSMAFGYRALCKTLLTYYRKHKLKNVALIISRWAPPCENDTQGYISSVCRSMNCSAEQTLDLNNIDVLTALAAAISKVENGRPANMNDVQQGAKLALQ